MRSQLLTAAVFATLLQGFAPAQQPAPPAEQAQGIEVQARGPVHEAFATPTAAHGATPVIPKKPPLPIEEMPPEQKPEGEVTWIGGYYHWDDDRNDFLWVSGCWRAKPPGKDWIAGYWREQGEQWQWVPGFWTATAQPQQQQQGQPPQAQQQPVTYLPEPPKAPNVAPPAEQPPSEDSFWVPGNWTWNGERYAWRPGYWGRIQPGYVWVPAHYRWTPSGYIFIGGYWDVAIARRGVLYAPVYVDPLVIRAGFVYTPVYAVPDAVVVDTLFVRPACCHYYFGDYYGPRYRTMGFESCYYYSRTNYDCIITYQRWEYRRDPTWFTVRFDLTSNRDRGYAPLPPRTLVQQNTIIQQNVTNVNNTTIVNNTTNNNITKNVTTNQMIAPASQVAAASGQKTVTLPPAARVQAKQDAQQVQQTAMVQRKQVETPSSTPLTAPRTTALSVPTTKAVSATPTPGRNVGQPNTAGLGTQQVQPATNGQKPVALTNPGAGTPGAGTPKLGTPGGTATPGQPGTLQKPPVTAATTPPGTVNPGTTNPGLQKPTTAGQPNPGTSIARPGQPGTNLPPLTPPPGNPKGTTAGQPVRPGQPATPGHTNPVNPKTGGQQPPGPGQRPGQTPPNQTTRPGQTPPPRPNTQQPPPRPGDRQSQDDRPRQ